MNQWLQQGGDVLYSRNGRNVVSHKFLGEGQDILQGLEFNEDPNNSWSLEQLLFDLHDTNPNVSIGGFVRWREEGSSRFIDGIYSVGGEATQYVSMYGDYVPSLTTVAFKTGTVGAALLPVGPLYQAGYIGTMGMATWVVGGFGASAGMAQGPATSWLNYNGINKDQAKIVFPNRVLLVVDQTYVYPAGEPRVHLYDSIIWTRISIFK